MFSLIKKWSSVCYIAIIMLASPCESSKAVSFHRHEVKSVAEASRGDPAAGADAPHGSPAYIKAHPPPPLCVADAKLNVYVGEDNMRTFTTTSGYWSDEANRNKVRCKGSLPSEKCLPVELRKGKADKESSPSLGLIAQKNRRSGSLRSVLMDAIEGPVPVGKLPTEASISGFGKSTDFAAQPPNPETKPAEVKGFKPGLPVSSGVPQQSPVHPAAKNVKEAPVVPNGSLSKTAVQGEVSARGSAPQSAEFSSHLSTLSCTSVSHKECPCAQDNDRPLLWAPHQSIIDKVEAVSLAVPEQKNRDLKKEPLHILVLGVGTGALSMSVLNNCRVFVPGGLKVESVEPDQSVATVAQNLFGFKGISGVHKLEVSSCGLALDARMKDGNAENGGKYDVVIINIFNGDDTVPTQCRNQTFLGQVKSVVKDQGVVLQSVHNKELSATLSDYTNIFGYKVRKDAVSAVDGKNGSYHIIVAGALDLVKSSAALPRYFGFAVMLLAMSVAL
eukprot:gnl/MRDRNA2_/MRDRNA2_133885_c0_seq1.p1 gnl/MRDRNA2_/MRDRNA2_133885_c0~~gnl/MRDRNA2_/MRDRNA2_133885_c0_seq1.p1  ORF type:complete len:502 (+),score=83.34 gnl/MRDRNA2_/MRDRNA2_133885_c0_seq1:269-1774(+)